MTRCPLCGATATDRAGDLRHEGSCPHFMRGLDAGGDPYEWAPLFEELGRAGVSPGRIEAMTRAQGGGDLAVRLNIEKTARDARR